MVIKDINISIAAGDALLFMEANSGSVSIEDFDQFLKRTGLNVYLIINLLLREKLVSITRNEQSESIITLGKPEIICHI